MIVAHHLLLCGVSASTLAARIPGPESSDTFEVMISPGKVTGDLTNFPVMVDLSLMPASFWSAVNSDGGNIRAYASAGGAQYPLDIAAIHHNAQEGTLWVKVPSITVAGGATFILELGASTQQREARGATYGATAVWSDYHSVFLGGENTDDRASTSRQFTVEGDCVSFLNVGNPEMTFAEDPHQGFTWHEGSGEIYTSDNNVLRRYSATGTLLASNTDPNGDIMAVTGMTGVVHLADICLVDDWLIVPTNDYPSTTKCAIAVFDRTTLTLISATNVSSVEPEISGICWNPDIERLVTCNWGTFDRMHKFALNRSTGAITADGNILLNRLGPTVSLTDSIQGIEYWRGHYWLSDDIRDEVVRVKPDGTYYGNDCPIQFSDTDAGSVTGNYEGIAIYKDGLAVLVDPSSANSYLIYSRPADFDFGGGGAKYGTNGGYFQSTDLTGSTSWTMAVSAARSSARKASLATFRDFSAGDTNDRVTLAHRFVTPNYRIEVWDNINGWLSPTTPINAVTGVFNRVATIYDGTTRKLFIDGAERASQTGITARDSGFTAFSVGIDDTSGAESFDGDIAFAYIRNGALSAAWLTAEHLMVSNPAGFYSIVDVPTLPNYFDGDFTTQPNSASGVWPSAVYDPTSNKTFYVWLAEGSPQLVRIAAYDHSIALWSEAVTAGRQTNLSNDTHGNPSIAIDHEGYIYVFFGNHVSNQHWVISKNPRDIGSWNAQTALSGSYTYPHPVCIGTDIYLFMRVGSTSDSKFVVRKASPSGGVARFGAEINLIDWTANNIGIYVAEVRAIGSEIEFLFCQQTGLSPQIRKHLFYAAWNPSTGALRNLSGSVSVASGSLPVLHTTATASFREVDSGSNITEIPSWCRDGSGDLHVVYFDGSANPYALKHMIWSGGAWSSPVTVVSLNGRGVPRIRYVALVPAGSRVELWYPVGDTGGWSQVGGDNMARRVWETGTWGSEEIIVTGDGVLALAHPSSVHNADPDVRVVFGESAQSELYNDRFLAKRYTHGASGLTNWPEVTDPYRSRVIERVVYRGTDNDTPANLDLSWVADPLTWAGNAKITGNRLALDGTGDYTSLGITAAVNNRRYYMNGTANKNSGEFCIDLRRIKFTNTTQTACVWGRGGTSGNRSLFAYYRGELTPDQFSFEYSFDGKTLNNLRFDFSPDTSKEYDFRISRDASGKLRIHHAESGSDLVMVASATISTGEFYPTTRRVNHGAYNEGSNTMNGSIGGTRVTLSDRGTTDANVAAADMAFDA